MRHDRASIVDGVLHYEGRPVPGILLRRIDDDQYGLTAAHILDDEVLCSTERLRRWASLLEWTAA